MDLEEIKRELQNLENAGLHEETRNSEKVYEGRTRGQESFFFDLCHVAKGN